MDTFQLIISVAFIVGAIGFIALMAYREGAKGALKALTAVAGETTVLDRVEGTITTTFKPEQIDLFRQLFFPAFALGLAIVPQGDVHETLATAQKIMDTLTDRLPNTPGTTTTMKTETTVKTETPPAIDPAMQALADARARPKWEEPPFDIPPDSAAKG